MNNPYLSLLRTACHYARKDKKKYLLVYLMFTCATLVYSLNPLLYGLFFLGNLQRDTAHVWRYALLYVGGYIGIKLLPLRFYCAPPVIERTRALSLHLHFLQQKITPCVPHPV